VFVKTAAASGGGAASILAASKLGGLAEAVLNAQDSQSQETEADDYGLAFLKKNPLKVAGAVNSLRKLAQGAAAATRSSPHISIRLSLPIVWPRRRSPARRRTQVETIRRSPC
jgi:predicted Zn-dependent protease